MAPNNSFKPNLLRYTNNVAEKACHAAGSATQVGLTQALDMGDPAMHFDATAAQERYRLLTDERLIEIAFLNGGHIPEAAELARKELESRGVSEIDHSQEVERVAAAHKERAAEADLPLPFAAKIFCVVIPGLVAIVIALVYFAMGRTRACGQAFVWMLIGVASWMLIGFVVSLTHV